MFLRVAAFSIPRAELGLSWRRSMCLGLLLCLGALLLNGCGSSPKPPATASGGKSSAISSTGAKTGRPYKIAGTWYYPREEPDYDTVGIASWYGHPFHGRRTANGEIYDMGAMTAAHTTLPLPSYVEVTNLDNGRTTVLRVNDRGPFVAGRIIDVSYRAAQELGFYNRGTARVRVRVIGAPPSDPIMVAAAQPLPSRRVAAPRATAKTATPAASVAARAAPLTVAPVTVASFRTAPVTSAPLPPPSLPAPAVMAARAPQSPAAARTQVAPRPAAAPVVLANAMPSIYIQAGAFADATNAERLRMALAVLGPAEVSPTLVAGRELHRVRLGPLASAAEAGSALARLQALGHAEARLVMEQPAGAHWAGRSEPAAP